MVMANQFRSLSSGSRPGCQFRAPIGMVGGYDERQAQPAWLPRGPAPGGAWKEASSQHDQNTVID